MKIYFGILVSVLIQVRLLSGQDEPSKPSPAESKITKTIIPTFLGNDQRNYYGNSSPKRLDVIWKLYLGSGKTVISRRSGERKWTGAGWTGQPLLVSEEGELYLIQGAYDHHLKKIDAATGKVIWQYEFDDVIKGTGSIWHNKNASSKDEEFIILQGSRLGVGNFLDSKHIPSYRAISYTTGSELWRLDVKRTRSYSRDVDGSALLINDTAYIGLENSLFTVFSPDPKNAASEDGMLQPKIYQEIKLYTEKDAIAHRNNVVTESSPCLIDNRVYIASGSGHVFGYDLEQKKLVWDFYIGSDIDGSVVATQDSCILVPVEKQYIKGKGGVFKLDPRKPPDSAVVWYFPVEDKEFADWKGGIIGSVGINDNYKKYNNKYLAAFTAIDGSLYVVNHKETEENLLVRGPNNIKKFHSAKVLFKKYIGSSISTPVFSDSTLIVAGYNGIFLFEYNADFEFELLDKFVTSFESTPIVYNNSIYIASRDGYFYCFGENE